MPAQPRRWEYSFGLHTCRLGDAVRRAVNPFTGAPAEFPLDLGLSAAEREALRVVLRDAGAEGPNLDGFYQVAFPGRVRVHLGFGDLSQDEPVVGAAVSVVGRELPGAVLAFLLRVARAANMAFVSTTAPAIAALPAAGSVDPKVRRRWPSAVVLRTPAELGAWLADQVGRRKVY